MTWVSKKRFMDLWKKKILNNIIALICMLNLVKNIRRRKKGKGDGKGLL